MHFLWYHEGSIYFHSGSVSKSPVLIWVRSMMVECWLRSQSNKISSCCMLHFFNYTTSSGWRLVISCLELKYNGYLSHWHCRSVTAANTIRICYFTSCLNFSSVSRLLTVSWNLISLFSGQFSSSCGLKCIHQMWIDGIDTLQLFVCSDWKVARLWMQWE